MGLRHRLELRDAASLARQREHIERGGILAEGELSLPRGSECALELVNPSGAELVVDALIAWVSETATYFAFRDTSPAALARVAEWATVAEADEPLDLDLDTAVDDASGDDADTVPDAPAAEAPAARPARARRASRNVQERLRGLTLPQQIKVARDGELHERTTLERMYGKAVWEALLRNPRLTPPEVAHLARMGAMPRPLLDILVGNQGWLQSPQVRRALLGNPRLGPEHVEKVLRLVPKSELRTIVSQTVYPMAVRHAAKRLLHQP